MIEKLTRNQSLVLSTLKQANAPLSAYTILDRLRDEGFRAPLQVYRALEKLIEAKKVHRLESVNAFMACNHPEKGSHGLTVFVICEKCGKVSELEDASLTETVKQMTSKIDFKPCHTTIEIKGICTNCICS